MEYKALWDTLKAYLYEAPDMTSADQVLSTMDTLESWYTPPPSPLFEGTRFDENERVLFEDEEH